MPADVPSRSCAPEPDTKKTAGRAPPIPSLRERSGDRTGPFSTTTCSTSKSRRASDLERGRRIGHAPEREPRRRHLERDHLPVGRDLHRLAEAVAVLLALHLLVVPLRGELSLVAQLVVDHLQDGRLGAEELELRRRARLRRPQRGDQLDVAGEVVGEQERVRRHRDRLFDSHGARGDVHRRLPVREGAPDLGHHWSIVIAA
jgi:hypothetical protein